MACGNDVILKAFYLFLFGSLACILPWLNLFLSQKNLSKGEVGALGGVTPFVTFVASVPWGILADVTHLHKLIFFLVSIGSILALFALEFLNSFAYIFLLYVFFALMRSPVGPLTDSAIIEMISSGNAGSGDFGSFRLWGAVGWGFFSLVCGAVMEVWDMTYVSLVLIHTILMFVAVAIAVRFIVFQPAGGPKSNVSVVLDLCSRTEDIIFFLYVFYIGMATGVIWNFLFIYISEELGGSTTLMGLCVTTMCLSEIPLFYFASRIERMLGGYRGVFVLVLVCYAIRVFYYSVVTISWAVLLVEPFHGITFACMFSTGVSQAQKISPEGFGATGQAMFNGLLMGLGEATGAAIGGQLYHWLGPRLMFRCCSASAVVVLFAFGLSIKAIPSKPKYQPNREEVQNTDSFELKKKPQFTILEAESGGEEQVEMIDIIEDNIAATTSKSSQNCNDLLYSSSN